MYYNYVPYEDNNEDRNSIDYIRKVRQEVSAKPVAPVGSNPQTPLAEIDREIIRKALVKKYGDRNRMIILELDLDWLEQNKDKYEKYIRIAKSRDGSITKRMLPLRIDLYGEGSDRIYVTHVLPERNQVARVPGTVRVDTHIKEKEEFKKTGKTTYLFLGWTKLREWISFDIYKKYIRAFKMSDYIWVPKKVSKQFKLKIASVVALKADKYEKEY